MSDSRIPKQLLYGELKHGLRKVGGQRKLLVHFETRSVTCSLNVRCESRTIPKSFAECDGRISFPSRVTAKLTGMGASI